MRDLKLKDGTVVRVADCKYERLQKYLEVFEQLPDLRTVVLSGPIVGRDCHEDASIWFLFLHEGDKADFTYSYLDALKDNELDLQDDLWISMRYRDGLGESAQMMDLLQGVVVYSKEWMED